MPPPTLRFSLADVIAKLMSDHGLDQTQLAKRSGVSYNGLGKILRGDTKDPDRNTMVLLGTVLGGLIPEDIYALIDALNAPKAIGSSLPTIEPFGRRAVDKGLDPVAFEFARQYTRLSRAGRLAIQALFNALAEMGAIPPDKEDKTKG